LCVSYRRISKLVVTLVGDNRRGGGFSGALAFKKEEGPK